METIEPHVIRSKIEGTVEDFFTSILMEIEGVEAKVLECIDGSSNLAELEDILTRNQATFRLSDGQIYARSKQEMDDCVRQGLFCNVVSKKDVYEEQIQSMLTQKDCIGKVVF
jgi:hypothetical protein